MNVPKKSELSLSHKLNEAWIVNEFFFNINDCEVREEDFLDFESIYGGHSIKASLSFEDSQGFLSGNVKGSPSLSQGGYVKIGWNAAGTCGGEYKGVFNIENVRSETMDNKRIVFLDLVDVDTRSAQGTFMTSFHKDKTFAEGVKKHIENSTPLGNLTIVPHMNEAKLNFAIPSNVDLHTWLRTAGSEQGYKFIRDKFDSYLVSNDWLEFDKLATTEEEFDVDAVNEFSFWRILQYNLDGFDVSSVMGSAPTSLVNSPHSLIENTDKHFDKTLAIDSKKTVIEAGTKGVNQSDNIHIRGNKQSVKNNQLLHQYFSVLSNAQKCSIWVPGLHVNRVGKKVRVNFPRPSYLKQDEYDEIFSGYWEVLGVRDKLIRQYFVQELLLRRPGGK